MRTRGRVDNWNNYEYKSLNREKRQRELLRVTRENQAILQRITMRKPELSAEEDHKNWLQNLQFMDNISQYPKNWWKNGKNEKTDQETSRSARSRTRSEEDANENNEQQEKDETRDSDENEKDNANANDNDKDNNEQEDNVEQKANDDKDEDIEQKETETA